MIEINLTEAGYHACIIALSVWWTIHRSIDARAMPLDWIMNVPAIKITGIIG